MAPNPVVSGLSAAAMVDCEPTALPIGESPHSFRCRWALSPTSGTTFQGSIFLEAVTLNASTVIESCQLIGFDPSLAGNRTRWALIETRKRGYGAFGVSDWRDWSLSIRWKLRVEIMCPRVLRGGRWAHSMLSDAWGRIPLSSLLPVFLIFTGVRLQRSLYSSVIVHRNIH